MRDRDAEQKGKAKSYADECKGAQYSKVDIGDTVLVQQEQVEKFTTPFNTTPHKVESKTGIRLWLNLRQEYATRGTLHM